MPPASEPPPLCSEFASELRPPGFTPTPGLPAYIQRMLIAVDCEAYYNQLLASCCCGIHSTPPCLRGLTLLIRQQFTSSNGEQYRRKCPPCRAIPVPVCKPQRKTSDSQSQDYGAAAYGCSGANARHTQSLMPFLAGVVDVIHLAQSNLAVRRS